MAGVNTHVKVTIDGPRNEVVHDLAVQYEVCLKMSTFNGVKIETTQTSQHICLS